MEVASSSGSDQLSKTVFFSIVFSLSLLLRTDKNVICVSFSFSSHSLQESCQVVDAEAHSGSGQRMGHHFHGKHQVGTKGTSTMKIKTNYMLMRCKTSAGDVLFPGVRGGTLRDPGSTHETCDTGKQI